MRARSLVLSLLVSTLALSLALPASASYRDDVLKDLEQLEEKLVGLAEAIPAEEYGWRPGDGVRSVSEALMHVAGGNFFFPNLRGVKPPEDVDMQNLEKVTDKEKVISTLEASYAHVRGVVEGMSDDELGERMNMFGQEVTTAFFLHSIAAHSHEHLGQMIAYARSLGVVPPWSQGQ